jgi:flagellar hook-associated protein 1 FlgK
MSDLLSLLSLGSAGMTAQNTGVSVATNNVANANTDGYSRQRVDLEALRASPLIGGVRSGRPTRMSDELLSGRIRMSAGSLAMSKAFSAALNEVESSLAGTPTVHEQLGMVFSRFGAAAAAPTDPSTRQSVITSIRDLVAGINRRANEFETLRDETNQRIADNAEQASAIAARLGQTNRDIQRTNDPVLRDERDRLATQLSTLVGGSARIDSDGQMRFVLDGGGVLVDGAKAAKLATTTNATTGNLDVSIVDGTASRNVTKEIGGGSIGADLSVRDHTLAKSAKDLDQLAYDVANKMNTAHSAGAGLDGVSGRPMFTAPTGVTGAAKNLEIDPALDADPTILATGTLGSGPGSNGGALALFALSGSGLTESALSLVNDVATQHADANASVTREGLVGEHLAGLRDSLSGVDIQEELTNLSKFEHASSAMTKFISTIDGLLGDLIDRI